MSTHSMSRAAEHTSPTTCRTSVTHLHRLVLTRMEGWVCWFLLFNSVIFAPVIALLFLTFNVEVKRKIKLIILHPLESVGGYASSRRAPARIGRESLVSVTRDECYARRLYLPAALAGTVFIAWWKRHMWRTGWIKIANNYWICANILLWHCRQNTASVDASSTASSNDMYASSFCLTLPYAHSLTQFRHYSSTLLCCDRLPHIKSLYKLHALLICGLVTLHLLLLLLLLFLWFLFFIFLLFHSVCHFYTAR